MCVAEVIRSHSPSVPRVDGRKTNSKCSLRLDGNRPLWAQPFFAQRLPPSPRSPSCSRSRTDLSKMQEGALSRSFVSKVKGTLSRPPSVTSKLLLLRGFLCGFLRRLLSCLFGCHFYYSPFEFSLNHCNFESYNFVSCIR